LPILPDYADRVQVELNSVRNVARQDLLPPFELHTLLHPFDLGNQGPGDRKCLNHLASEVVHFHLWKLPGEYSDVPQGAYSMFSEITLAFSHPNRSEVTHQLVICRELRHRVTSKRLLLRTFVKSLEWLRNNAAEIPRL